MSKTFDDIVAGGYYQPFGSLTQEQLFCQQYTKDHLEDLLTQRQRDKFLHEVKVCACGYEKADEEEPIDDNNFSQFQFYRPYTEDLVFYEDRFDFLIKCIANGVCKIAAGFEERYQQALLNALTFREITEPQFPEYVLELRQVQTPRTVMEQNRSEEEKEEHVALYVQKKNSYADNVKAELARLEEEQAAADRKKEGSLMGWEERNKDIPPPNVADAGNNTEPAAAAPHQDDEVNGKPDGQPVAAANEQSNDEPNSHQTNMTETDSTKKTPEKKPIAEPILGNEKTPMLNLLLQIQADTGSIE